MNFYLLIIESKVTKNYPCCGGEFYPKLEPFNSSAVKKAFSKFICSWINPFECMFVICSCEDIYKSLNEKLFTLIKPSNYMLLEIDLKKYNGFLPSDCWDWIKENQEKRAHELKNTNSAEI